MVIIDGGKADEVVHGFSRDDKGWVLAIWRGVEVVVVEGDEFEVG